jgi:hypothetical protein
MSWNVLPVDTGALLYSELCNKNLLDLTGMHWLVELCDVNSLLLENQNNVIADPSGDVRLKEIQNNLCVIICFTVITIMQEKIII